MGLISEAIKKKLPPNAPDFAQYGQANPTPMLGEVTTDAGMPKNPDFSQYKDKATPVPLEQRQTDLSDASRNTFDGPFAPISATQGAANVYTKVKGGEDPYEVLLGEMYMNSEAALQRRKKASLLGDLAQIVGQGIALGGGARKFEPIKSDTSKHIDSIDRLRQGYNSAVANSKMADIRATRQYKNRENEIMLQYAKEEAIARLKAALKSGQIDQETAAKIQIGIENAKDKRDLAHINGQYRLKAAEITQEGANTRNNNTNNTRVTTTDMNNASREKIASMNNESRESISSERNASNESIAKGHDEARIKVAVINGESSKNKASGSVGRGMTMRISVDGRNKTVNLSKDKEGALVSLLPRMNEILEKDKKDGTNKQRIDKFLELKSKFDSGDARSRDLNLVSQMIQYFPELNDEFMEIVNAGEPTYHESSAPSAKLGWGKQDTTTTNRPKLTW